MEIDMTIANIRNLKLESTDVIVVKLPEGVMPSQAETAGYIERFQSLVEKAKGFVPGVIVQHHGFEIKKMTQVELKLMKKLINGLIK